MFSQVRLFVLLSCLKICELVVLLKILHFVVLLGHVVFSLSRDTWFSWEQFLDSRGETGAAAANQTLESMPWGEQTTQRCGCAPDSNICLGVSCCNKGPCVNGGKGLR